MIRYRIEVSAVLLFILPYQFIHVSLISYILIGCLLNMVSVPKYEGNMCKNAPNKSNHPGINLL